MKLHRSFIHSFLLSNNLFFICAILALVTILTWLGSNPLGYDEPWYLGTVQLFEKYGLSSDFFRELPGPAGPLYTFVHAICKPLTHLELPGVRWINPVLALIAIYSLYCSMKSQNLPEASIKAYSFFAIPIVWSCTGLALTEIPAVCMYSLHLCLLFKALSSQHFSRMGWAFFSGLFLGLAILGRQPLLLVLGGLGYLGIAERNARSVIGVVGGVALLICLPVFLIWQGLVPPTTASVAGGFSWSHVWVGLYFSAIIFLILCPRWLILDPKIVFPILLGCTLLNVLLNGESILPIVRLTSRIVPQQWNHLLGQICMGGLRGLGILFVLSFARQMDQNRKNPVFVFLLLSGFSQVLAMGTVTHQTSNRYLMTSVPAFILLSGFYPSDKYRLPRFFVGASIGALILISHLKY